MMAEFATLLLSDIFIPERLRGIEEDHALAISTDMAEHGQISPIMVRRTPNGAAKYTLVAGAHRCRALELLDEREIDAIITKADKADAQLLEISENLFRNDLSVIDRAVFVQTYRDLWEQKHGKIQRGGDKKSKVKNSPLINEPLSGTHQNPIDLLEAEAAQGFSQHVAARLGVSKDVVKRLHRIAKMERSLREALRGKPEADSEGFLYRLSSQDAGTQAKTAAAIGLANGDVQAAIYAMTPPKAKPSKQDAIYGKLLDNWTRASKATRARFLADIKAAYTADGEQS
jgi:ParB family chromosome partitioning protein